MADLFERRSNEPYVPNPPHPANAPGPFYVEDGCCMARGVWEQVAPDLLAWMPEDEPQCFVKRQPVTDPEFIRMMNAMKVSEVDCIRVKGCRPDWEQRLREAGLTHQIHPSAVSRNSGCHTEGRNELYFGKGWQVGAQLTI